MAPKLKTRNSKRRTGLELAAKSSGGIVQRVSRPVQRGVVAAPPVGAAEVGIVAISQKAPVRPPRRFVRLFQPRFAALVEAGKKFQTVRPLPKREQDMPRAGDLLDARAWLGAPYRSKQRKLGTWPISRVVRIEIARDHYLMEREGYWGLVRLASDPSPDAFARADGFADYAEMAAWFRDTHGLPFTGILIDWLPF